MTSHSDWIPSYITAQSLMGLRRLMFLTNARAGTQYKYFDIQQFNDEKGKSKWVAWFYKNIKDIGELENDDAE